MSALVASARKMVWSMSCGMFNGGGEGGAALGLFCVARDPCTGLVIFSLFTAELALVHSRMRR